MLARFEETVQRMTGDDRQGRILLGVSGGIDSMTLADLFSKSRFSDRIGIAHVNFSLRGEDSEADQAFVRDWAAGAGLPFYTIRFDTLAYARERAISTQMAARELRYGWFRQLMEQEGYDWLAIAHNLDDGVETLFLNLLRGTGYRGLVGIRPVNGMIIRPLSEISRASIRQYVQANQLAYREDRTNQESHYSRNRLRNLVFPQLEQINPSFRQTLHRDMQHFAQVQQVLDEQLEELRAAILRPDREGYVLQTAPLLNRKQAAFWTHGLLAPFGFNETQIQALLKMPDQQAGRVFRTLAYELVTAAGQWRIVPLASNPSEPTAFRFSEPGEYVFKGQRFVFACEPYTGVLVPDPTHRTLYFDAGKVVFPLTCRSWQPSDRFCPFGMKNGSVKLSDFFINCKLDLHQKQLQPVITTGEAEQEGGQQTIVLLPGLRSDHRFRVTPQTRVIGKISLL